MTQTMEGAPRAWEEREKKAKERNNAFLTAIQQLYETDRGRVAALKRSAGDTLAEARGLAWFEYYLMRYMPGQSHRQDSLCLLVASLMCFDRKNHAERRETRQRRLWRHARCSALTAGERSGASRTDAVGTPPRQPARRHFR